MHFPDEVWDALNEEQRATLLDSVEQELEYDRDDAYQRGREDGYDDAVSEGCGECQHRENSEAELALRSSLADTWDALASRYRALGQGVEASRAEFAARMTRELVNA